MDLNGGINQVYVFDFQFINDRIPIRKTAKSLKQKAVELDFQ